MKKTVSKTRKKVNKKAFDIRKFRHGIAVLKRKGLVDKRLDARSVQPTDYLKRQVSQFRKVIAGEATALKVSKSELANYKKSGFTTKKGRVVMSIPPGYKTVVSHGKVYQTKKTDYGSISRLQIPVPYEDLEQWLLELGARKDLDNMKARDEYFAFRFYNNDSYGKFMKMDQLADNLLNHYFTVFDAIVEGDPQEQLDVYRNIEIVKFKKGVDWKPEAKPGAKRLRRKKQYASDSESRARRRKAYARLSDRQKEAHRARARVAAAQRRAAAKK